MCNYTTVHLQNAFHLPKLKLWTHWAGTLPTPFLSTSIRRRLVPFPVSVDFMLWAPQIGGIMQYLSFNDWLTSLSKWPPGFGYREGQFSHMLASMVIFCFHCFVFIIVCEWPPSWVWATSPWLWLGMLSSFSRVCWPLRYLPHRNVSSSPLPIFKIRLFVCFVVA